MSYETVDNVKYYLRNNEFYIVGDNSSTYGNGITDNLHEGEIIIYCCSNILRKNNIEI